MKVKIGTQLDQEVYRKLKIAAVKEKSAVSDLLQTAVCDYLNKGKRKSGHRSGLRRFLDSPSFELTNQQFRETMEADFYDQ